MIDGYYPRVFTDYDLREAKNMGEVRLYPKASSASHACKPRDSDWRIHVL